MDRDMEERLKLAEEYIHQQYVNECKDAGWDIRRKAKAYESLPSSMHDDITDLMMDQTVTDYLQVLFSEFYEHKLWTVKDYESAPPYVRDRQPMWMYVLIEKAVEGTFELCIRILMMEFEDIKKAGLLGDDTGSASGRNFVRMMRLMHRECQIICLIRE